MDQNSPSFIVVQTTLPDEASARELLRKVVETRLAACGHMHKLESAYWWNGKIHYEPEWLLSFKSRKDLTAPLEKAIADWHPYDVPMIMTQNIATLNAPYAGWLIKETS